MKATDSRKRKRDCEREKYQCSAVSLEYCRPSLDHQDRLLQREKVQKILTEMYVRAKKRGRPKKEKTEKDLAA